MRRALSAPELSLARRTARVLDADLTDSWWDWSPGTVTDSELRSAHRELMKLPPRVLARVLAELPADQVNRYVERLAEVEPWDLHDSRPTGLERLAQQLSELGAAPPGHESFLSRLDSTARIEMMRAVMSLPDGRSVQRFRRAVGDRGFRDLVRGSAPQSIIARALLDGRTFARNVTGAFKALYNQVRPDSGAWDRPIELPANRNDYQYLLLPGLFGRNLPGYMEVNRDAMVAAGVSPERISKATYNTTDSTHHAAVAIARQINARFGATGQKAVLMTHSMGGAHARTLLTATAEELLAAGVDAQGAAEVLTARERVAGNLLMQPAFNAQIAKDVHESSLLDDLLDDLLWLIEGNEQAFRDMSRTELGRPFPGNKYPTVVLASDTDGFLSGMDAVVRHYYVSEYGTPSDGAVPTPEQVAVAGADVVYLPNAGDHMRPSLDFAHVAEHFARMLERGEPDDVLDAAVARLRGLDGLAPVIDLLDRLPDDPQGRRWHARKLRDIAPTLDVQLREWRLAQNTETLDPTRGTQACLRLLLERLD